MSVELYIRSRTGVAIGASLVLGWRVIAYAWPSPFVSIPDALRTPTTLLGMLFMACGLYVWSRRRNQWVSIFLAYALGSGIHWGGPFSLLPSR